MFLLMSQGRNTRVQPVSLEAIFLTVRLSACLSMYLYLSVWVSLYQQVFIYLSVPQSSCWPIQSPLCRWLSCSTLRQTQEIQFQILLDALELPIGILCTLSQWTEFMDINIRDFALSSALVSIISCIIRWSTGIMGWRSGESSKLAALHVTQ